MPLAPLQTIPTIRPRPAAADLPVRWAVAACVLLAVIGRGAYLAEPFAGDSGLYAYLGRTVWQGGLLYRDAFDTKPPGVGLLAAGVWAVFGGWWPGWILLQLTLSLAAAWSIGRAARRTVGPSAGVATGVAAAVFLSFSPVVKGGFQLETIQASLACFAAGFAMRALAGGRDAARLSFVSGLLGGAAMMVKPTGAAVLGAMAIALLLTAKQRGRRDAILPTLAAAGGALVPTILVALWAWRSGVLPELPMVAVEIWRYGRGTPVMWLDWYKPAVVAAALAFPSAVRMGIFRGRRWAEDGGPVVYETYRSRRDPAPRHRRIDPAGRVRRALWAFALSWALLELLGVMLQRRMYAYHFLPLAGPAALCFGLLPRRAALRPMLAGLGPIALISLLAAAPMWRRVPAALAGPCACDRYLAEHLRPGESVFADHVPPIVLEGGFGFGSRFGTTFHLVNDDGAPRRYTDLLLSDLSGRRPLYVMLPADLGRYVDVHERGVPMLALNPRRRAAFRLAWERIGAFVASHYAAEATVDGRVMWRRK